VDVVPLLGWMAEAVFPFSDVRAESA